MRRSQSQTQDKIPRDMDCSSPEWVVDNENVEASEEIGIVDNNAEGLGGIVYPILDVK